MLKDRPIQLSTLPETANIAAAYRDIASFAGDRLRRMPCVGTGEKERWTSRLPLREAQGEPVFGALGYADEAIRSYGIFRGLRDAGEIAKGLRLQVSLPAPVTVAANFVPKEDRPVAQPAIEAALTHELERIAAEIPHDDLAIEWVITTEFFTLETGGWSAFLRDEFDAVVLDLARLGDAVPETAELGYRFSYGNLDRTYLGQQSNAARMYTFANGILGKLGRAADWLQLDIPADRSDPDYFVPLAGLRRFADTRIFLGLIHPDDDVESARRRLTAALTHLPGAGIAAADTHDRIVPEQLRDVLALSRALQEITP